MAKKANHSAKVTISHDRNPYDAIINVFKTTGLHAAKSELKNIAEEYAELVRDIIESQQYKWPELKEATVLFKQMHDLDPRTLVATGEYLDNIGVFEDDDGKITVGVADKIHEPSGLPLYILAKIHEFGSKKANIPPRQVWRPALSVFIRRTPEYKKKIAKKVDDEIQKELKKIKNA